MSRWGMLLVLPLLCGGCNYDLTIPDLPRRDGATDRPAADAPVDLARTEAGKPDRALDRPGADKRAPDQPRPDQPKPKPDTKPPPDLPKPDCGAPALQVSLSTMNTCVAGTLVSAAVACSGNGRIHESHPDSAGLSWIATCTDGDPPTSNLAVCVTGLGGTIGVSKKAGGSADCGAGKVIGGGCECGDAVTHSAPDLSQNLWRCECGPNTPTATYAICAYGSAHTFTAAVSPCPGCTVLIGGACQNIGVVQGLTSSLSTKLGMGGGWSCSTHTNPPTPIGICAK